MHFLQNVIKIQIPNINSTLKKKTEMIPFFRFMDIENFFDPGILFIFKKFGFSYDNVKKMNVDEWEPNSRDTVSMQLRWVNAFDRLQV